MPPQTIGSFQILRELGRGGMTESLVLVQNWLSAISVPR